MFLKRLEVSGFKSFADKTVIDFNSGLTAVVGPNGSGKSNITEAIRWVLGEQSAKSLRGGTMPDVIFAGSSSRSPLNIAEVTLVLDNEDTFLPVEYSEVSVTRRLTRSGDSDFFINKQACRLKDIINLFMDSGLGRESFSIISQGKVEEIFNSKPEDRRGIFEEAAGVLKYKTRKKEAEKRLSETEDNLSRLQDIIYELENQLEPLSNQSHTAKEYLALKEELTEVDVLVTVSDMEQHKKEWLSSKASYDEIVNVVEDNQGEYRKLEERLSIAKQERIMLDDQLEIYQQKLLSVTQKKEQLEGQKRVLDERKRHSHENQDTHSEAMKECLEKSQGCQAEIHKLENAITDFKGQISQQQMAQKALEKDITRYSKSAKTQLEELRSDYVEVMQQQTNVNNDLKHLERRYQQEQSRSNKELTGYDALTLEKTEVDRELEQVTKACESQERSVKELVTEYQEQSKVSEGLKQRIGANEIQMYEALKILQQAQARQKSLQELQDNYSGYYRGVKAVLKEKQTLPGIVGAVAELITVPSDMNVAIETALGAASQHIIVADESSARSGIQFLKQQRVGRATFLPLTTIKPRQLTTEIIKKVTAFDGFVGIASELVTYPENVTSVIQNILGLTIVAKDLQAANRLAKELRYQFRIVSLEGDVMNPGGSMTGGASKQGQSNPLFSQTKELNQLVKQIGQMEVLYNSKENEVRTLKRELQELEVRLLELRKKGEESRLHEQTLKNKSERLAQRMEQLDKELKAFEYEANELKRFMADYEEEKEQLLEAEKSLKIKRSKLDDLMSRTDQLEEENTQRREQLQTEWNQRQSDLAVLLTKLEQGTQRLAEKKELLEELDITRQGLLARLDSESSQSLSHLESTESLLKELDQVETEKEQLVDKMTEQRQKKEALALVLGDLETRVAELTKEIQEQLDLRTKAEVAKNRTEMALDTSLTYLQEEYHLTYEGAKETYKGQVDLDEGKGRIQELKQKIQGLGAINLQSIEQHDEVKERYDFLAGQQADLMTAKEELFETMNDMDELVIKKFHEVFCDIREEFRVVFPNMFGGGHADLVLTDPSDLLHTGIDIVAQPPGKKLQNLSLLSGGERALTAIALLFAIIQARPVPFCILDEVEAALDDANVTRFGQYLRNFGDDIQFIVITHRKGTMEAANVLYGVTMQESGVSKIVSVHLEEIEKQVAMMPDIGGKVSD